MDWEFFSNQIEELGYFRYVKESKKKHIPRMLQKMKKTHSLFSVMVNRDYPADEERLAECGVKNFMMDIMSILRINNVIIDNIDERCSRDGYNLNINGKEFVMYSGEEVDKVGVNIWNLTKERAFSMINKMLRVAGSDERIFSLYGGNDHWCVFLTLALHDIIVRSNLIAEATDLKLYEDE